MYAAARGEHMSPLNIALWSICKSSLNVLKVCESVASRYLIPYAAGKKEHVEVAIDPENAHNVLNVLVHKIENKKLGGVGMILAREAKQDKTQGIRFYHHCKYRMCVVDVATTDSHNNNGLRFSSNSSFGKSARCNFKKEK